MAPRLSRLFPVAALQVALADVDWEDALEEGESVIASLEAACKTAETASAHDRAAAPAGGAGGSRAAAPPVRPGAPPAEPLAEKGELAAEAMLLLSILDDRELPWESATEAENDAFRAAEEAAIAVTDADRGRSGAPAPPADALSIIRSALNLMKARDSDLADEIDDDRAYRGRVRGGFCLPRAAFRRLVREIAQEFKTDLRFESAAFDALQEAAESELMQLFRVSAAAAAHANRTSVEPSDMQLVRFIHDCERNGTRGGDMEHLEDE